MTTALVIGIGHPFRGDDAIGPRLAEALDGRVAAEVIAHHGEGADLMDRWQGRDHVVVVDAMVSGAALGTTRMWEAVGETLPANLFPKGSHLFGLAEAVEMARLLGRLPSRLTIIGVEGGCFSLGAPLSPEVDGVVTELAETIRTLLG